MKCIRPQETRRPRWLEPLSADFVERAKSLLYGSRFYGSRFYGSRCDDETAALRPARTASTIALVWS